MTSRPLDSDPGAANSSTEKRVRADVLASAVAHSKALGGEAVADLAEYLADYFDNVSAEDLQASDPIDLLGTALANRQLGRTRSRGETLLRVYNPTVEENGWSNGHTVVEVVSDDMPFLVDSLSAALSQGERAIHLVIHPRFSVHRDDSGELVDLVRAERAQSEPDDRLLESWIHIDIDRESDADELLELASELESVLADVRAAVEDWVPMRDQAMAVADQLAATDIAGVPGAARREAADFLRWLAVGNFTFLGYRRYDLVAGEEGEELAVAAGSGLGITRGGDDRRRLLVQFPDAVRERAREAAPLLLTKANSKSRVHRAAYLDYVGLKIFDDSGAVVGEHRFLGLYAAAAYTHSVEGIPVLRAKVAEVTRLSGFSPDSHSGKDLELFLETYPRDELFQIDVPELYDTALAVLQLQERRRVRLFLRADAYGRFMSCLVYLPRDRYTTRIRLRVESLLREALNGDSVEYQTRVSESVLARLHYVVRVRAGATLSHPDQHLLEREIAAVVRSWEDSFDEELTEAVGEEDGARLTGIFRHAIPESYKEAFPARTGVADVRQLDALADGDMVLNLYRPYEVGERYRRLKIYRSGDALSLSLILPILQNMGVHVIDERPFTLATEQGGPYRIYDLGLELPNDPHVDDESLKQRFEECFLAVWSGLAENDGFNSLVLHAALDWQQVVLLRAFAKYLRQVKPSFSFSYIEEVLIHNPDLTACLVALFRARFDPAAPQGGDEAEMLHDEVLRRIDDIAALDADRILRLLLSLITHCVRTSYFQRYDGEVPFQISFKFLPRDITGLPEPRPMFEIWVYSPVVEGVHLRYAAVARGGLRWSDRREDFRTEILGLVKAQEVKNTVIVPAGAKGGFIAKQLPSAQDREGFAAAGRHAYVRFISGLLNLTDNRVTGEIVPPPDVVRYDEDDPYLVVAADKGTATFSDLANSVSAEYGFWLGDAFASGGSEGYDHKGMGITARGAWESVKRHFRELGIDTQTEDFTCVGIGDMSGDVFGNGMLLSRHIRLIAAFDHRHIFLDPDPNAEVSFAERQRLFELPRSSWDDYNRELLSAGGGVFPRTAKSIPISDEIRTALAITSNAAEMSPADLIRAVLRAQVQLLWNGGIGTYVKSRSETDLEVGDKANDAVRVDGRELRCEVVGEGGNLGFTQLGRIEAALTGVRLNTDAIDNSAGVDTSDHEVNIKILLSEVIEAGDLTVKQRNNLLREMTPTVADLVLRDNYAQNRVLGVARAQAPAMLPVHRRMIQQLVADGELDRELEFLPSDEQLDERAAVGEGLTSPELSVLLAYAKMTLADELRGTGVSTDPYFQPVLQDYFPDQLTDQFGGRVGDHPLAPDIIRTAVVNDTINNGGIAFIFRAREETVAKPLEVVRGYVFTRDVFQLPEIWRDTAALDNLVPTAAQNAVLLEVRRLMDRGTRWMVQTYGSEVDLTAEVARYQPIVAELEPQLPQMLRGGELARWESIALRLHSRGIPEELAFRAASLLYLFSLLDVVRIADRFKSAPAAVAELYFVVSERYEVDEFLTRISGLPREGRWEALARQAMRSDLYQVLAALTAQIVRGSAADRTATERLDDWELSNQAEVSRVRATLHEISLLEQHDIASLSVALRALRTLVAQSRA
jgi:glutamate dehydrogenase